MPISSENSSSSVSSPSCSSTVDTSSGKNWVLVTCTRENLVCAGRAGDPRPAGRPSGSAGNLLARAPQQALVAQRIEQGTSNPKVVGSIPTGRTTQQQSHTTAAQGGY